MNDFEIAEVLGISDEELDLEFIQTSTISLDIRSSIVAATNNPIGVASFTSSPSDACCCTISNNTSACGGDGIVLDTTNCLPGGA